MAIDKAAAHRIHILHSITLFASITGSEQSTHRSIEFEGLTLNVLNRLVATASFGTSKFAACTQCNDYGWHAQRLARAETVIL